MLALLQSGSREIILKITFPGGMYNTPLTQIALLGLKRVNKIKGK